MRKCPTCAAPVHRVDFICKACGHVLEEMVAVKYVFATADDVRTHFGKIPTFERVLLAVEEPLPEGTLVGLRMILPPPAGEMTIPARVTASAPTPSTPATPYRLQLQLLLVDREKQNRLKAIIAGEPLPEVLPVRATPTVVHDMPPRAARAPEPFLAADPTPAAPSAAAPAPGSAADEDVVELDLDELLRPVQRPWWPPASAASRAAAPSGPVREIPPEHLAKVLTEFVMHLTRAITKTSYYEADHLAAQQAKVGLYDTFKMLVQDAPEITFLNQAADNRRSVLVHGIFDEPTDLERVMLRGQAELFGHKLASYLESKALLSVSFKQALDHGEFHRFVDLLATPGHLARGESQDLIHALAAHEVRNISVVFKADLVTRRKLTWRLAVALTRLKTDLSRLPLFESLRGDDLTQARYEVFRDVVRPFRQVNLLRELLLNADVVSLEVAGLSRDEVELLILEAAAPEVLPDLLGRLTRDVVEGAPEDEGRRDLVRVTRTLARLLGSSQRELKESVFRQLFGAGVLTVDELPPAVQEKVAAEEKAERFLRQWRSYLESCDAAGDPAVYQKYLDLFLLVLPELLSRHELEAATKVALLVAKHRVVREGFPTRASMAGVWLTQLSASPVAGEIVGQLMSTDKVRREAILTLCGILGEGAVPILFKALCDCPTRSIRLELCELLEGLKEQTSRFLAAELDKTGHPWYFQRNLLNLMGRVGGDADLPLVGHFLSDKHPRVRLEALLSVCVLDPASAEKMLVWGLSDPDPDIRGVSVRQLVQRRSPAQELFDHFRDILWEQEPDEEKVRQACGLLASYQAGDGHEQAVDILLDILRDEVRRKGFWSRLGQTPGNEGLKILACQTLGRMRAKRAVGVLTALSEGRNRALRQAAVQALRFIQQSERV